MEQTFSWLFDLWLGKPVWMWVLFLTLVGGLLAFDLGVLGRRRAAQAAKAGTAHPQEISVKASLGLSAFYIAVALLFGGWVWLTLGAESGMAYLTGFAVEKTLALDNVFVISVIFGALAVPRALQHRVLFWGILGVIVLRGIMIGLGAALVSTFDWVMWVFGAFLLLTGVRLLFVKGGHAAPDLERHPVVRALRRVMPISPKLDGEKFVTRLPDPAGRVRLHATPLLLALLLVEAADLVFAVDSIPAIFAITQDPFIVYTSNIFAILGLRALYFALDALIHRFAALKPALALVLVFIGGKIFYNQFYGKLDPAISLGVTLVILGGGVVVSLWQTRGGKARPAA